MDREEQRADRADDCPTLIDWRCLEDFQNSELYPVTDYLERFINAGPEETAADQFERLARHLEVCGLGRPEIVALFAKLLLLPAHERYPQFALTPAREREQTFAALREWLLARLAPARCSSLSRICIGLTPRLWNSSLNLLARDRTIEFSPS